MENTAAEVETFVDDASSLEERTSLGEQPDTFGNYNSCTPNKSAQKSFIASKANYNSAQTKRESQRRQRRLPPTITYTVVDKMQSMETRREGGDDSELKTPQWPPDRRRELPLIGNLSTFSLGNEHSADMAAQD